MASITSAKYNLKGITRRNKIQSTKKEEKIVISVPCPLSPRKPA